MQAIREITQWRDVKRQPNHVYLMDGQRAVAYMAFGEGEPFYFKTGWTLDRRGRKFEPVEPNPFDSEQASSLIEVKGSKGNSYWVDPALKTCTCPGYTFRGSCKHVQTAA